MWIKICANTNLEDALLAAHLGADAVGFVFAPSVRQVTAAQVAQITPHLPKSLERVGVFPAWNAQQIATVVREAGLTSVQLHGAFDPTMVHALDEEFAGELRIIQTVHWSVGGEDAVHAESQVQEQLRRIGGEKNLDRVLVDSRVGAATGGTGVAFDWSAARSVFEAANANPKLILAGGLRAENVADAIVQLRPWGVDVASGVEASAGRKDPDKLVRFFAQISVADSTSKTLNHAATPRPKAAV